jgi:fumarate hydratase class II
VRPIRDRGSGRPLLGTQTQRSLVHFSIGDDRMPKRVYHAYGYVKKAAALVNAAAGRLPQWKADAIVRAADEAISGKLDDHFPLYVWQTGSRTQSNTNVNEVLSNRAIQLLGGKIGSKSPVHPNDDVNMGQSSNDTFPTAMHIAAVMELEQHLLLHAEALAGAIEAKANQWMDVVETGRTHLMDAVPLTVGQGSAAGPTTNSSTPCATASGLAVSICIRRCPIPIIRRCLARTSSRSAPISIRCSLSATLSATRCMRTDCRSRSVSAKR